MLLSRGDLIFICGGKYGGQNAIFQELRGHCSAEVLLVLSKRYVVIRRRSLGEKILNDESPMRCHDTTQSSSSKRLYMNKKVA